jgi:hypothetical protein
MRAVDDCPVGNIARPVSKAQRGKTLLKGICNGSTTAAATM